MTRDKHFVKSVERYIQQVSSPKRASGWNTFAKQGSGSQLERALVSHRKNLEMNQLIQLQERMIDPEFIYLEESAQKAKQYHALMKRVCEQTKSPSPTGRMSPLVTSHPVKWPHNPKRIHASTM